MTDGSGSAMIRQFRTLFEAGTVAALTDGQLLERFLDGRDPGGQAAFEALVARHGPMVLGVCRRALADPDDAADAFQATFLILVKKARSVRVDDSLGRWLYGVSRKVADRARLVAARRPRGESGAIDQVAADLPDPDRFEILAMLDEELVRLPEAFRSAIVLCDLGGLTHEDAARDLRCPVGTIKSRLARGRQKLRERLERRGVNPSVMPIAPTVPAALLEATARMSWLSTISSPSTAGMVPASSVLLAQEVLKVMTGFKLKLAVGAMLSLGVVATGAGMMARGQEGAEGKATAPAKSLAEAFPIEAGPVAEVGRCTIEVLGERVTLDGESLTLEGLTNRLKSKAADKVNPLTTAYLRVDSLQKFRDVLRVKEAIQGAGVRAIYFEETDPAIRAKLDQVITIDVVEKPVVEVVQMLSQYTGLKFFVDGQLLDAAKKPVTLQAKAMKLRDILDRLLQPLSLTYRVEDYHLVIIREEATQAQSLAQLQEALKNWKKRLEKALRIATSPNDPAIVRASREVAQVEAEIARIRDRNADAPGESPDPKVDEAAKPEIPRLAGPYRPRRVEELVKDAKPVTKGRPKAPAAKPARKTWQGGRGTEPPREFSKVSMPEYVVEPPDIVVVEVLEAMQGRPITGERLVRPDGSISLGFYGKVQVAGLTTTEIKEKVALHLREFLDDKTLGLTRVAPATGQVEQVAPERTDRIFVDVVAYNSKVYYVQGDVGVPGRLPITGNETVLDGITFSGGILPTRGTTKVRLVRPNAPGTQGEVTMNVDLPGIINRGDVTTNYQLMPGDRLIVENEKAAPVEEPATKPEAPATPDVEARFQALERKLDEILKALSRPIKP